MLTITEQQWQEILGKHQEKINKINVLKARNEFLEERNLQLKQEEAVLDKTTKELATTKATLSLILQKLQTSLNKVECYELLNGNPITQHELDKII